MTPYRPTRRVTRTAVVGLAVVIGVLSSSARGGQTSGGPAVVSSSSAAAPAPASTSSSSTTAGPSTSSTSSTSKAPSAPAATAAKVTIKDFMFGVPASVAPGTTVTVTNQDAEAHTVTSKTAGFDVKVAGRGGTTTFTAPKAPGSYKLTCDFHADMAGVLVVS